MFIVQQERKIKGKVGKFEDKKKNERCKQKECKDIKFDCGFIWKVITARKQKSKLVEFYFYIN